MTHDLPALLLALAGENADLRGQLAQAHHMLVETAIDAGNLHARIEAVLDERDAWRARPNGYRGRPRSAREPLPELIITSRAQG